MRVPNHVSNHAESSQHEPDVSRRQSFRRIAAFTCAVVFGSIFLTSAGCQTTKNSRDPKTVDEFLEADKPSW